MGARSLTSTDRLNGSFAQLVGTADQPQCRVQDRHPIAQPFGLLQPVRGQEDRHPTQRRDQVTDLARRHGIKARGRLVKKQHRRVVGQRRASATR
jgi:hypothetical protein